MKYTMACLGLVAAAFVAAAESPDAKAPQAARFKENPIIRPELSATIGKNINGPSLIRAPEWLEKPLGKYYLYFAEPRRQVHPPRLRRPAGGAVEDLRAGHAAP